MVGKKCPTSGAGVPVRATITSFGPTLLRHTSSREDHQAPVRPDLVVAAVLAVESGGPGGGLELAGSTTVVVQSGDTLWSIAGEIAPEEDRRAVVDALLDVNGLSDVDLVPGQVLELP